MTTPTISPARLAELSREGKRINPIDVRTPVEYREVHVEFARNLPLDQLDPVALKEDRFDPAGGPLYFVCRSGNRSQQACERLLKAGLSNVFTVEGGIKACVDAGLPVVRGKRAVSLDRQVRIVSGSLVLIGVLLGWLVHPGFAGLAAFIGAGNVFSGVTDTCGMGMLLSRMPWNRCHD